MSGAINDGGPAFPVEAVDGAYGKRPRLYSGMNLRAYFAARAPEPPKGFDVAPSRPCPTVPTVHALMLPVIGGLPEADQEVMARWAQAYGRDEGFDYQDFGVSPESEAAAVQAIEVRGRAQDDRRRWLVHEEARRRAMWAWYWADLMLATMNEPVRLSA